MYRIKPTQFSLGQTNPDGSTGMPARPSTAVSPAWVKLMLAHIADITPEARSAAMGSGRWTTELENAWNVAHAAAPSIAVPYEPFSPSALMDQVISGSITPAIRDRAISEGFWTSEMETAYITNPNPNTTAASATTPWLTYGLIGLAAFFVLPKMFKKKR